MPPFSFQPNDLHRLNRLVFAAGGTHLDPTPGGHRARQAGEGTEFLDFRPYVAGDDFRKIDWNLYGRLRQLIVRLQESPRQLSVHLLVDVSRSMDFGSPVTKMVQALRIAAALGFVALRNGDRVLASCFADSVLGSIGPLTSAQGLGALIAFLQKTPAATRSDLAAAAATLRSRHAARGLIIVLSDFLNVPRCEEALAILAADGARILAIQVLDDLDRGLGLEGSLRLRDAETGQFVDVRIDRHTLAAYQGAFESRRLQLESHCRARRHFYVCASTSISYIELVCRALRSKAVVQ